MIDGSRLKARSVRYLTGRRLISHAMAAGGAAGGFALSTSHVGYALLITTCGLLPALAAIPLRLREQRHRHSMQRLERSLDRKVTDAAVGRLEPPDLLLLLMILRGNHSRNPKAEKQDGPPDEEFLW
jgi:hypothetical protein